MTLVAIISMFADATDPISGGAGWVGAGLLGAVLYWLARHHLPAKDAQVERMMQSHTDDMAKKDAQMAAIIVANADRERERDARAREMAIEYKSSLQQVVTHCEQENAQTTAAFNAALEKIAADNRRLLDVVVNEQRGQKG